MEGLVISPDLEALIEATKASIPPAVLEERYIRALRRYVTEEPDMAAYFDACRTVGKRLGEEAYERFMRAWLKPPTPPGAGHVLYASADYYGVTMLRKGIGWEDWDFPIGRGGNYYMEKPQYFRDAEGFYRVTYPVTYQPKPSEKGGYWRCRGDRTQIKGGRVCLD